MKAFAVGAFARVFVALAAFFVVASCGSPEIKRSEAASAYAAQQADCIAKNKTRETIDACRDEVKARWSLDAGGDK